MEKPKILIIDDDKITNSKLCEYFEKENFNVDRAFNGKDGYDKALSLDPDIIILDITMPIMDGITMLKKLREDEWGEDVKVVMLTNISNEAVIRHAMELYVTDYLIKSNNTYLDVLNRVKDYLKIDVISN